MRLARTEHPPWTGPFVMPDRHALVETYDPGCDKSVGHVLVPSTNHLADLPKLVDEVGWRHVSESEVPTDHVEPLLRHEVPEIVRARVRHLITWSSIVAPVVIDMPAGT